MSIDKTVGRHDFPRLPSAKMSKVALIHLIFMAQKRKHLSLEQRKAGESLQKYHKDQRWGLGLLDFDPRFWFGEKRHREQAAYLTVFIKQVKGYAEPDRTST